MNLSQLTPSQEQQLRRLADDFPFYARNCLKIVTKEGKITPFVLNSAQTYLYNRIMDQKRRTGMVRIIVVKGRQQGVSTLIEGLGCHITQFNTNTKAFILTHHSKSTEQLFSMVKNYVNNFPKELGELAETDTQNRNQLSFKASKSSYSVGTAGSDAIGRGFTLQFFHGSEVAFWENTSEIAMGALKAVNPVPNTYIILESTANGVGNYFHNLAIQGLDKDSTYETVFIPWYWQSEYRRAVPAGFQLTDQEMELKAMYNLTDEQLFWRRRTILEDFEGEEWKFQQEYPNTLDEAFVSGEEAYFDPARIAKARKARLEVIDAAPKILGIDIGGASEHADRSVVILRQGRHLLRKWVFKGQNTSALAANIALICKEEDVDRGFIDIGNAGPGVFDRLVEDYQLQSVITPVNFGQAAIRKDLYQNKRAEMICEAKKWTDQEGGTVVFDENGFIAELMAHPRPKPSTVRGTWLFKSKEEIKDTLKRSPDEADAFFLTFAFPVPSRAITRNINNGILGGTYATQTPAGGSRTLNHFRNRQNKR